MKFNKFSKNACYLFFFCVLILSATTSTTGTANATDYYVATTGNDTNPGTEESPWQTVKFGVKSISAGDTLFIKAGTYVEKLRSTEMTFPAGTSWSDAPVISGFPGDTVILAPGKSEVITVASSSNQYLIFKDFIIDGTGALNGISLTNGANHIRFQNIEIKLSDRNGILSTDGSGGTGYNEFINLNIHEVAQGDDHKGHGMYIATDYNIIEDCEVHDNNRNGIQIFDGSDHSSNNNIIRRNTIYNNGFGPLSGEGMTIGGTDNLVYNNIIYSNLRGISLVYGGGFRSLIFNNTIWNNTGYGITDATTQNVIKNNIVYGNGGEIENTDATNPTVSNNLTSAPYFVDSANGNFHITEDSNALDAGTILEEVTDDFDESPRPQGGVYDIGAFEFVESSSNDAISSPTGLRVLR